MRNRLFLLAAACALLVQAPQAVGAQRPVFDSIAGKYRVEYHSSHLGRTVSALVDPPNRIEPSVRLVEVQEADGEFSYRYVAANGRGLRSKQSVVEFDFDCPDRDAVSVTPPENWGHGVGPFRQGFVCILIEGTESRGAGIAPGGRLTGLEVRTAWLPALGTARFWGDAAPVQWPAGESMEALDLGVIRAVEELEGVGGGWVQRPAVVPNRDHRQDPLGILQALDEDLVEICQPREWISEPLCRSYRAALAELVTAVREERFGTARERIQTFLNDLQAAHESPQGQLEPDAYWLLRTNLEAVAARLQESLSAEAPADSTEVRGFWSRLWSALRTLPPA